ncbi:MAG: type I DNA topoisomerase [Oscillospiraceae bacterium]|nr:type I DNA topoisomerase [Oscillospiraceae bacterium]
MAKAKNLVIVESPSKAKTIEKYLGSDYKVKASMGHLRDLPKSQMGVDVENNFEPKYIPVKDKHELIAELKKDAKSASLIYLATDPDREGEAISWHLKELLQIPDEKALRVTFNEITKKVVTESIQNPREIDEDLVNAQQARRVLDRIVGYELSPLLWRKVKRNLSAGRVQSVATRIVVDRENEIRSFVSKEYWLLDAHLSRAGGEGGFTARFHGVGDKKTELGSAEETQAVAEAVEKAPFVVSSVERGRRERKPQPPFITSTLQQEASRKYGITPRRCMSIAQQLYEGVEITGQGSLGLITYMRTDSLRLSEEAIAAARSFISKAYGEKFLPAQPRRYKAKEGAQDAHEAIRPSDVFLTPESIRKALTAEQYKLYTLIWERFTACQMSNAEFDSVAVNVESAGYTFRATYSEMVFAGHTQVYKETKDEESSELRNPLPNLTEGEELQLEKLTRDQQFTQPPARYTEATLIRAMEEKGIGRPSTYAPTISTITAHDYVIKEGRYLRPTNPGEAVTEKEKKDFFPEIVDHKVTNEMETRLDEIENGSIAWQSVLSDFYGKFEQEMHAAEENLGKVKVPEEESEEICEVCGRNLVKRKGKFGYFLACPGFPECSFTKPIVEEMPGKCPKCGSRILKHKSSKGYVYYACEKRRGEVCDFITWDVPTKDFCPTCGKTLFKPGGRGPLKSFCVNVECAAFVPEEKRRYQKKPKTKSEGEAETPAAETAEKPAAAKPARKAAAKKPAAKAASAAKKPAAKKTAAKTTKTTKKSSASSKEE